MCLWICIILRPFVQLLKNAHVVNNLMLGTVFLDADEV